MKSTN